MFAKSIIFNISPHETSNLKKAAKTKPKLPAKSWSVTHTKDKKFPFIVGKMAVANEHLHK